MSFCPRKIPFEGIKEDLHNRLPLYCSDYELKSFANLKCLASVIFIFFALLGPSITFGTLLSNQTKIVGIVEVIVATAIGKLTNMDHPSGDDF